MPARTKPSVRLAPKRPAKTIVADRSPPAVVPTEDQIREAAAGLKSHAQKSFAQTLILLREHLGSDEAARLWLVTPSSDFGSTPLTAIQNNEAEAVLAFLEAQWGPGSVHA